MYQNAEKLSIVVSFDGTVEVYCDPENPKHNWLLLVIHPGVNRMVADLGWFKKRRKLRVFDGGRK